MSQEPLLRPEEVASVLSEDGSEAKPQAPGGGDGTATYSLREPRMISAAAEGEARRRVEALIAAFQRVFRRELESGLSLELDGFQQRRAEAALSVVPEPAWVLSFERSGGGGLALVLHPATALALVEQALGGLGNSPDSGRPPTPLETRVMTKLATTLAPILGAAIDEPLTSGQLVVGRLPVRFATPGEIVGTALVRVEIGRGRQTSVLLVSTRLLGIAAQRAPSRKPRPGPLAPLLEKVRLPARPVLEAGRVRLGELTELRPGVVLELDAPSGATLQLRVAGLPIFSGFVVRRDDGAVFEVVRRSHRRPADEQEKANDQ